MTRRENLTPQKLYTRCKLEMDRWWPVIEAADVKAQQERTHGAWRRANIAPCDQLTLAVLAACETSGIASVRRISRWPASGGGSGKWSKPFSGADQFI